MERVAIVGLGLIGGSLGLAVKAALPKVEVIGVARRDATAHLAIEIGAADRAGVDSELVAGADLVVLACPLRATADVLAAVVPHLKKGARVTDVGSVKAWVVERADKALDPDRNSFVGGHPMAGKEVTGIKNADPELFRGRPWVFTPRSKWSEREQKGFRDVIDIIRAIGAEPVFMTPEKHDRYVALVSHLPFLLSAAFLEAVAESKDWDAASALASSGFRDISRLGAGDPEMYAAILEANRDEVLGTYAGMHRALDEFEAAIARGDRELLLSLLRSAQQTRRTWAKDNPDRA
ncbi:MAG: prephenate dehydrogenase/arogenate dehydrogenase family protein [Candidatus Dormiibacterota bacterium]